MNEWITVAMQGDLFDGASLSVDVQGREVALFQIEGRIHAIDNICSHGDARLCDGFLLGHEIECPFHQGRFDVRTGEPTCAPLTEPVKVWPVRIQEGKIWVRIENA